MAMRPKLNQLHPSQQSLDQLKTKHSLIASDIMKIVKTYFEHARFVNQPEEVKAHAWWGVHPDCYAPTGRSSRREVSWSGVGFGLSALATCDADVW